MTRGRFGTAVTGAPHFLLLFCSRPVEPRPAFGCIAFSFFFFSASMSLASMIC
jgi:hypothetical protein